MAHLLLVDDGPGALPAREGARPDDDAAIVAESSAMRALLARVRCVAPNDVTVLVRGETGTGKERIAALLHARSGRAAGPFVRFNCAAVPAELAESVLFGHSRGAFTGATAASRGYFAEASGGTLVLDEVGELPLGIQAKLLRALQEQEIQPLGSSRIERVDVRIVACTNRNLEEAVRAGTFREDLYYRLTVVELVVPPLRDHREDIPALAGRFVDQYASRFGKRNVSLSPALLHRLATADWPGNVRQLENVIARLIAFSTGGELSPRVLDEALQGRAHVPAAAPPSLPEDDGLTLGEYLDRIERDVILRALDRTNDNRSEAARRLGLSRAALHERIRKYGIPSRAPAGPRTHGGDRLG